MVSVLKCSFIVNLGKIHLKSMCVQLKVIDVFRLFHKKEMIKYS